MACSKPSQLNLASNVTERDIYRDSLFGPPLKVPSLNDAFQLTEAQKEDFLKEFHSVQYRDLSDSQRVFKYLQQHLQNFNFHSETLLASDALSLNTGNCMSLAVLTKAISKLTHVGISYELARTPPVFQRENNLELSSQHIRSVVYNKTTKTNKQFIKPNDRVKIDYFSTAGARTLRKIKTKEFYSLFYSNLAAEALLIDDINKTYWLLKESLSYKNDNLIAINILGVLYDRMKQDKLAENTYLYGLEFDGNQLELMNNYHQLLVNANRLAEAQTVATAIQQYDDPDPFKWLDLADQELKSGRYIKAITYYERAIEKAEYLHQPYAGIAKANFLLGRSNQAVKAMEMALENVHHKKTKSIYQAKYRHLKSQSNIN